MRRGSSASLIVAVDWPRTPPAGCPTVPQVSSVPSSPGPKIPSGLKVTCLQGPNTLNLSTTCPVVQSQGLTWWAQVVSNHRLLFLGPVAGVFADRWPRRHVMIVADLLSSASVGVMLLASARSGLWLLLTAVFAENAFCTFFSPACTGLVPAIVGRDSDLAVANSWFAVSGGIQRLAVAPLGGALYAVGGFRLPAAIDAASYLASALLVALIGRTPAAGVRPSGQRALTAFASELHHGLASLVRNSTLRLMLAASSLLMWPPIPREYPCTSRCCEAIVATTRRSKAY